MTRMFNLMKFILVFTIPLTAFFVLYITLNNNILLSTIKYIFIQKDNEALWGKALQTYLHARSLPNYNLLPKYHCREDTDILVVAISHISNYNLRNKIRNCWRGQRICNDSYWTMCHHNTACDLSRLRLVFLTGRSRNVTTQKNLEDEHFQFDDIIQGTFNDTYRNLVHKSVLMLDYAVNYCRSAKFIQKIDTDVKLNVSKLSHLLVQYPETPEGYIIGFVFPKANVRRTGKWQLSESEYRPHQYPAYVNGPSYIISRNASTTLLNVARKEPLVHIEDAFITGICRNKTNVKLIHSSQFCISKGASNCATKHHR